MNDSHPQQTRDRIRRLKDWVTHNERLVTSGAFLGGFGVDLLTLTRIDQWFDNAILLTYLVLASLAILIINTDLEERFRWRVFSRLSPLMLYIAQFAFGGLLSGFVIFYTKSASWYVSWPFLVALYVLFLANDRFRPYYRRLEVQTAMLFGGLFGMAIFFVPTTLGRVGDLIFLLSGIVSVILMVLFLKFLYALLPTITLQRRWKVRRNVAFIFITFQVLYFTHLIPPIPLSLKHGDIYHNVASASAETYTLAYEYHPWYRVDHHLWRNEFNKTSPEDRVFAFVSVFGPENLNAPVYHKWQWLNPETELWQDVVEIDYEVSGGRDRGFRWYSYVTDPTPGKWRVRVTTQNDRELGRIPFTVLEASRPPLIREREI